MLVIRAPVPQHATHCKTRQSEMADLARRATRWVGTLSDGEGLDHGENVFIFTTHEQYIFSRFFWRRYYILKFHGNTFR